MQRIKLHIVAFDIPFPPDYGGAIDVFYKLKNLSEAGVELYLHCPLYGGRKPSPELEELCAKVWYYDRIKGVKAISPSLPYMMYSRRHKDMLKNLQAIDAPILFEGVSTTFYLRHPSLSRRFKILRNQNIEQDYFSQLAQRETHIFRKVYYQIESILLKRYEDMLHSADAFFTVAQHDHQFFKEKYPEAIHEYIPSFQPYNEVVSEPGNGAFCLYHGNLGLAENKEAAEYLLNTVVPQVQMPFIIAGRNPPAELLTTAARHQHCKIIANPSMQEMEQLIKQAHIHVLPTFQNTGLKLKLLHALFNGRHVLVNQDMVHGTGLSEACIVAEDSKDFVQKIISLAEQPFSQQEIQRRKSILGEHYNNQKNALRIIKYLQQRLP